MKPRDYQEEDVGKIFEEFKEAKSTLYVAATGLGKTFVMTEVAKRMLPKRAIMLAHRTELISQAKEAFERKGMLCEIEKAELQASTNLFTQTPVVLATVQTLLSGKEDWTRMQRFNPKDFGLLLYDESHHSISVGNKKIVEYFTQGNPELKVLGVTATPDRADEEALGQIFETVASERDILWGRDNGWLVDVRQNFVPLGELDFSEMRTTAGDLNSGDLAAVMEQESCISGVVQPTIEHLFDLARNTLLSIPVNEWTLFLSSRQCKHRAITFTVSVLQAEMLCNIFNRVIPDHAAWICGKTRDDDRVKVLNNFKAGGQTRILVNCGVTTEGYDNPDVDTIVVARPTKSRSLYAQMIGRGTRPIPGLADMFDNKEDRLLAIRESNKPCVTVMDFVGNCGKHKLICTADLLGGKVSDEAAERAVKIAKERGQVNMTEVLAEAEEQLRLEAEQRRLREEARKAKVVAKVQYSVHAVDPFNILQITPAKPRGWDAGRQLSEKQRALLLKQGINPDSLPYAQAKQVIGEIFNRWGKKQATFKQAKVLMKYGYKTNVSMSDATKLIDALAANGWRKPSAPATPKPAAQSDGPPIEHYDEVPV